MIKHVAGSWVKHCMEMEWSSDMQPVSAVKKKDG
jgi:hypothetical protein